MAYLEGLICAAFIPIGIAVCLRREKIARRQISFQNRLGFHFGEKELRITERVAAVVGSTWVLFGVACLAVGPRDFFA